MKKARTGAEGICLSHKSKPNEANRASVRLAFCVWGTRRDAVLFSVGTNAAHGLRRTNDDKRRNLNKGQWSAIAVEAEDVMNAIAEQVEKERLEKQKANAANQHTEPSLKKLSEPRDKNSVVQKIAQPIQEKSRTEAAKITGTNHAYVNAAEQIKATAPDLFEKMKAGNMTMQDARREAARRPETDEWLPDERGWL